MKKGIFSLMLALCFALGLLAVPAAADGPSEVDISGLTAAQARAMLDQIAAYTAEKPQPNLLLEDAGCTGVHALVCWAGDGEPVLFLSKGYNMSERGPDVWEDGTVVYDVGEAAVWSFRDGALARIAPQETGDVYTLYPNHLEVAGGAPDGSHSEYRFYSFADGASSDTPFTTFVSDYDGWGTSTYTINGTEVTEQEFVESSNALEDGEIAAAFHGGGVEYLIQNIPAAEETAARLWTVIAAAEDPRLCAGYLGVTVDGAEETRLVWTLALQDENGYLTYCVTERNWKAILGAQAEKLPEELAAFHVDGQPYYKLRDLGRALEFNVGWSAQRGVFLETDKPYDPED